MCFCTSPSGYFTETKRNLVRWWNSETLTQRCLSCPLLSASCCCWYFLLNKLEFRRQRKCNLNFLSQPVCISFSRCLLLLVDLSGPLLVPFVPLCCLFGLSIFPVSLQLLALLVCLAPLLLSTFLLFFLKAKQTGKVSVGLVILHVTVLKKLNFTIIYQRKQQGNEHHLLGASMTDMVMSQNC